MANKFYKTLTFGVGQHQTALPKANQTSLFGFIRVPSGMGDKYNNNDNWTPVGKCWRMSGQEFFGQFNNNRPNGDVASQQTGQLVKNVRQQLKS